jgi:hypothetical protein
MVPSIIFLKIHSEKKIKLTLWLPVFLLWPFLLILLFIAVPFLLLAEIILAGRGAPIHLFGMVFGVLALFSSMRGTKIKIESPTKQTAINVAIY